MPDNNLTFFSITQKNILNFAKNTFIFIFKKHLIMKKLTFFLMALLFSITSMAVKQSITATWNIEEGATLPSFKEVTITFAGTDSVGRTLVGTAQKDKETEVKQIVLQSAIAPAIFFSVDADGNTTPVSASPTAGALTATRDGLVCKFSIANKGYNTNSEGNFVTPGNYRIVLPGNALLCSPNRQSGVKVFLEEDYILNFTISGATEEEEVQTDTATVTTMQELETALGTRSKVVVLYKNLKPVTIASSTGAYYDDYMPDGTTPLNCGFALPADFDCYGTYAKGSNDNYVFTVDSIVGLHAFANLYLIENYYQSNQKDANILSPLKITEPVVVTAVQGNNVFVQYAYARISNDMFNNHLVINGTHNLKVGDQIASFTAQYNKQSTLVVDEENTTLVRNAYFAVEATSLGETTADNTVKYKTLSSISNIANSAAVASQLPSGGIIVKEGTKYFYTIGEDSLQILPATSIDIESFVGKEMELSIKGVVDYCNTADYAKAFIANSIKEINTNYESISQWLRAAAEGEGEGSLKNPVVVTHSEYKSSKQYIFIGDATGGLCLIGSTGVKVDSIKTGHVITGVAGKLDFSDTKKTPQLSIPNNIQVVDSNKTIEPIEVTIAELLQEEDNAINNGKPAIKYANRLVKISKVVKGTKWIGNNSRVWPLIQNGDTLAYAMNTLSAYHANFSTTTPMAITGIVDFRCINTTNLYSIYPRSTEDVKDDFEKPVITPEPGTHYTNELEITITCADTAMTAIYYSFDPEVDPTIDGELYEGPIKITSDTTIWYAVEYGEKMSELYVASYNLEEPGIHAVWSIEEGAVIDGFAGVTITFSGVDSIGRKLDGVEVQKAVAQGSSTNILFYSVDAEGKLTQVDNGTLNAKTNGLSVTYTATSDKGYNDLVDGKYMKQGNYRIVIDAGDVLFTPNRKDANGSQLQELKVYNTEEYVLNFTIENDYQQKVDPVQVDATFTANPADNSEVKSLSEVVVTFTDKTSVTLGEIGETPNTETWPFINQTLTTGGEEDELGGTVSTSSQPVAPMYYAVVEGKTNAIRFYIASDLIDEGTTAITTNGTYTLTIPAGVVMFSETEINKPITLNYTVKGNGVNVEVVTIENIYTYNGTIMADSDIQIFTITGQNVTNMNGNLQNGVYIVKTANATAKVVIK